MLEAYAGDSAFQQQFRAVKHHNKIALARLIGERLGIQADPGALFDVQIKRIHEYKRQLLNVLETVALYHAIKDEPQRDWVPRVKIFAGKAAASYRYAKLIIKLINDVAATVNNDPAIGGKLKVAFLADYNVSLAEVIIPAADLSEQISTAGMEASGTGNMKLALNGALTIGTLDGANIEIRDHVGAENIAIFGMEAMDVVVRRKQGLDATDVIARSPHLARAIKAIETGDFSPDDPGRFASIGHALRHLDHYMVSADFDSYYDAQRGIDARWQAGSAWARAGILNVARMAWFSSDRTIAEYAQDIWDVPVKSAAAARPVRTGAAGAAQGAVTSRAQSAAATGAAAGRPLFDCYIEPHVRSPPPLLRWEGRKRARFMRSWANVSNILVAFPVIRLVLPVTGSVIAVLIGAMPPCAGVAGASSVAATAGVLRLGQRELAVADPERTVLDQHALVFHRRAALVLHLGAEAVDLRNGELEFLVVRIGAFPGALVAGRIDVGVGRVRRRRSAQPTCSWIAGCS